MSTDQFTTIVELLRTSGGRVTATRKTIVRALVSSVNHHVTVTELTAAVRDVEPDFQESTVYRTLERLAELGVVQPVHFGTGPAVYHLSDGDHAHVHLHCRGCGAVIEASMTMLQPTVERVAEFHDFRVDSTSLALTGRCASCIAATNPRRDVDPDPGDGQLGAVAAARRT